MKTIEIKNRWNDTTLFSCEITVEDMPYGQQLGFAVRKAVASKIRLSGANLSGADLRGADLRRADLSRANLSTVKQDFLAEVLHLPNELEALKDALLAGQIDGSMYSGSCACLAGTLAKARGISNYNGGDINLGNNIVFHANAFSPREMFFTAILPGDTPEKNGVARIALQWTEEAIAIRDMIRATAPREAV
jgi:hypothetical protein